MMEYLARPITKKMLSQLISAKEKMGAEDDEVSFLTIDDFKGSFAALYRRGILNTEMARLNGKRLMKVYITSEGLNLLQQYDNGRGKSQLK